jgi:glycosyltransferase involved in cell wall biosynthesis
MSTWMSDVSLEPRAARIAFGPAARRYASRLPPDLSVIVADHHEAAAALGAAVERRRQGRLFYVAALIEDVRALASGAISGALFVKSCSLDERRHFFDALADDRVYGAIGALDHAVAADTVDDIDERARVVLGLNGPLADARAVIERFRGHFELEPIPALPRSMDERERRVLRDFVITGDALLVRSHREADRIAKLLARRRPFVAVAPGRDDTVPRTLGARTTRSAIVVWAPDLDASSLGVIAMALDDFKTEVVYICASGSLPRARGTFVRPSQGAAALSRARCVIDASTSDPGSAIALADLDVPLVVATTSGAGEFLDGGLEYDPWNWRTVYAAVAAASAHARVSRKRNSSVQETLEATLVRCGPPRVSPEPLVSVLIITCNRPHMLGVALESVARQSYKNIEVIVVNNGSASVADVVATYPSVRLIENGENLGIPAFFVRAMAEMRGKYFCALADDDIDFPDFLVRLVFALEHTGAYVAHGNTVTRYFTDADGRDRTVAYRVRSDRALDPLTIRCGATMTLQSMLLRSSIVKELGGMDPSLGPIDLDYQIRASQCYDFVHVDAVTCCWNYGMQSKSFNNSDELARGMLTLYERYPSGGSRLLERMRERELKRFENRATAALWGPDLALPEPGDASLALPPEPDRSTRY